MNDIDGDSNDMFLANLKMKSNIVESLKSHAKGHIDKHKANVEVLLQNPAGVAEHPDVVETIEKELEIMAKYDDQLHILDKYFK